MRRIKAVRLLWGLGLVAAGLSLAFVLRRVVSVENGGNRAESDGRSAYLWKRVRPTITEVHSEQQRPLSSQREIVLSAADGALDCLQRQSMPRQLEGRWQQWGEIFLVFFGKPIMQALKTITSSRGWQVKLMSEESPEKLQSLVSPERFLVVFTSSKLYHHRVITELANSTNALVGTVGNAYKVTGAKRAQLSSFRRHFQSFGCEMEAAGMMPRSFILDNPTECVQFFRYSSKRPEAWWVLKPSSGQGGDGISIHSNLSHFYGEFATCMKSPDAIVQEYITDPLLLGNRKFDVRAYILIARTSPHFLVFYHDGYLRLSMKEFDIHGEREVHLTNSHVQVKVEGFSMEKHFWSFKDLQAYLDEHRPGDGMEFVSEKLVPFIQKVGLFIAHTAEPVLSRAPSNFLMMGLDFMVTSDLQIQFIEANNYPLWPRGTHFMDSMIQQMGNDMFDLLFDCRHYPDQFQSMHHGDQYGTWTLIWNELFSQCSKSLPYDPCREFSL